jgi:hypothetical protein
MRIAVFAGSAVGDRPQYAALATALGTSLALFEAWSRQQLGLHAKPVALLGPPGFWQPLTDLVDHLVGSGFVRPARRSLITATDPAGLLDALGRGRSLTAG